MKVLVFILLSSTAFAKTAKPADYDMTLTVNQTKQVPFVHGANKSSNTDCQMIGNNMECNTTDNSFQGFQGMSYMMVATGSDGKTYMFGCDAQWRWSHCTGLNPGDTFNARHDGGRIAVQFRDAKQKVHECKYQIFQVEVSK